MSILGIGIDIVNISRIASLTHKKTIKRLASRILTSDEELMLQTNKNPVQFLSTRWAAKEAAYKAAYPHAILSWKDINVIKNGPRPEMYIKGFPKAHLSISHDGDLCIAQCIIVDI